MPQSEAISAALLHTSPAPLMRVCSSATRDSRRIARSSVIRVSRQRPGGREREISGNRRVIAS